MTGARVRMFIALPCDVQAQEVTTWIQNTAGS